MDSGTQNMEKKDESIKLEKIVIAIDWSINSVEREARRLSNLPTIENILNDVREAKRQGFRQLNFKSGIHEWANARVERRLPPLFRPICPGEIKNVKLASRVEEIAREVLDSDVLLLEAPTGSGKSVIIPTVMEYVARFDEHERPRSFAATQLGSKWKVIHVSPTSEQAVQNMEWVRAEHERQPSFVQFGVCTSAVGNGKMRKNVPINANYVYATTFYGEQALSGVLHGVVIDDVHELTPDTIKLLRLVRQHLSRDKQHRPVFKLILLSATLSNSHRQNLMNYFEEINGLVVHGISMGEMPFANCLMLTDDERLMRAAMEGREQNHLYENEVDKCDGPHIEVLTNRSVAVQEEILRHAKNLFPDSSNPPGIISFHPGKSEVCKARAKLVKSETFMNLKKTRQYEIVPFKVSGSDRSDLEVLREYAHGDPMRVIHSTPLLSYGVTLPGIYFVVDDGTMKLPGRYSHAGVVELITRFEDRNMMIQKKGRVSRVGPGAFLIVVSKRRYLEILKTDHTLERLDRAYRTNHVPFLLEHSDSLLVAPETATLSELLTDMLNTGMMEGGSPTAYAKLLGNTFAGLSLALCDFVVRCCAFGIGLHGVVFAASCCTEHRAIRRASSDGAGRDDPELPMNRWSAMTEEQKYSDIEQVTEMALNFLLARPAAKFIPKCRKVGFPYSGLVDVDGVDDARFTFIYKHSKQLFRRVVAIFNSLSALGCVPDGIHQFFKENLKNNYHYEAEQFDGVIIYILKSRQRFYFNACLLASLGSRVAYEAPEKYQNTFGERRMFVLGDEPARTQETVLVKGERAFNSRRPLAIYDVVVRRASQEKFMTGFLHYVSMMDYALYGNVIGSNRDEINTNTVPVFIKLNNARTLRSVIRIRKILRAVSIAAVVRGEGYGEFMGQVKQMVDNLHGKEPKQIRWKLGGFVGNKFSAVPSDGIEPAAGKNGGNSLFGIPMKNTRGK